ncbi:uncharacterized protein LOC112588700 [Harpegnathos saltator]|uniref:uncharacterized protein LOC112588700 n=1 Tax=Harpegnathos saltator TaxID=610380 RepID=UPI000DBED8E4|nr:uncharacterized protein LOC112588700 [Harpegnathos saltator]
MRVTPLRRASLPRLELCSAQLLSRLMQATIKATGCGEPTIYCWTDSSVALLWIGGYPSRWTTFVASRVSFIHETTTDASWHYVPSGDNPADCASRGLSPGGLRHALWWHGPSWFIGDPAEWPSALRVTVDPSGCEERRRVHLAAVNLEDWCGVLRASSFRKTICMMAYVRQFLLIPRVREPLSADELRKAQLRLLRITQNNFFGDKLAHLPEERALAVGSVLRPLNPAIYGCGLLCVGGRLQFSALPADTRQPVLLPRHSQLVALVARDAHERTLHGRVQLTLVTLRRQF